MGDKGRYDITEYSKSKGLNPSLMTAALPAYDSIRRCCVHCGIFKNSACGMTEKVLSFRRGIYGIGHVRNSKDKTGSALREMDCRAGFIV